MFSLELHTPGAQWEHGLSMTKIVVFVDFIVFGWSLRMSDLSNMFEVIFEMSLIELIIKSVAVNYA